MKRAWNSGQGSKPPWAFLLTPFAEKKAEPPLGIFAHFIRGNLVVERAHHENRNSTHK